MSYIPASDSQYILNGSGATINPSTEESIILLRRIAKLLEPIAVQDSFQRQRITLDGANTAAAVTVAQATSANLNANIGTVTNIVGLGGVDPRFQFIESARISYSTGVRNNLKFS